MNDAETIARCLSRATDRLRGTSESPRLDAELLLSIALDVPRSYLFAHPEDEPDDAALERFGRLVSRRADEVPIAYLAGEKEFWSLRLAVNRQTLIPRPDTEILVAAALARIADDRPCAVLDLGTGSGAIAVALASERPAAEILATDIDPGAVAVARENARRLGLANLEFAVGDWLKAAGKRSFDVIVSNPPYVASDDPLLEQLRHEPRHALAAGTDGLDAIRCISKTAAGALRPGGTLLLEHGSTQGAGVAGILQADGWQVTACLADLAGLPRVSIAERPQG